MKKQLNVLSLTIGLSLVVTISAGAQTVYEGFNYPAGSGIEGASGGTGWTANWGTGANVNLATNASTSLTYQNLLTSGGSLIVGDVNSPALGQARPNRNLPDTLGNLAAPNGGFIWMSFLYQDLQSTTGSPFLRQANLGLFQGSSEYWDLGLDNTSATVNNNVAVWDGGHGIGTWTGAAPLQSATAAITQGTTMLFVVEFIVDNTAGTADTANVWIDPTLGSSLGTPNLVDTTQDLTGINNIRFQANNSNANGLNASFAVDELRLGDSPLSVMPQAVPEPTVFGLMAVGGLALVALRRKRQ